MVTLMMRREKIIYSIFLVAVIVLAWTVANFYVMNNNQNIFLVQEQAKVLASFALTMETQTRNVVNSFRRYYDYIESDLNWPNMTENTVSNLEHRSFILLGCEADSARYAIQTDSSFLTGFHLDHAGNSGAYVNIYANVSETVNYAVYQLDWTTGRSPTEHHRLMFELCNILGADRNATANNTQLTEISQTFTRISSLCWNSQNQVDPPVIDMELSWALGNATELNQHLVAWHNSNPHTP
jgi:hypothetical protein